MKYRIRRLPEFIIWFEEQDAKGQAQINTRILKIEMEGYFGDARDLGEGLAELRWKSGRRIYFGRIRDGLGSIVLLIVGGNKNGQTKDIKQAKLLLRKYSGN